ncbi:hypothetical protein [Alicyclobacillus sendaiensis]|uniref:hypothetical protein n=1 Tax=Alicyclobacillus sendaiensis TaxID=192387 RepID=UPI0026F44A55|nr:hypothetical protein [Alicyclobacillus sendaiensis]
MEQPPLWLTIATDAAQILTPLVAIPGFWFAITQINVAKRQAEEATRQAELMAKQLELEIQARQNAYTPYFALVSKGMSSNGHTDTYTVDLINYGSTTAFEVRVGFYQQSGKVEVVPLSEYEAIPVEHTRSCVFQYPSSHRADAIELYVKYKNIYGDCFYQSWQRVDGMFKPLKPPTIVSE